MSYGMIVSQEQLKIIEENEVEYCFWDIESVLFGESEEEVEIEFDNEEDFNKARKLLKRTKEEN